MNTEELTRKFFVNRNYSGFTLIELLVVVAIISLLSSVVLASLSGSRASARNAQRQQDLRSIQTALELYYNQNGEYPATPNTNLNINNQARWFVDNDDCTGNYLGENWIPELVEQGHIADLPVDPNPGESEVSDRATNGACYIYTSDGSQYILSAWATVENGPHNNSTFYKKMGPREHGSELYCNFKDEFYRHSYTLISTDISWCDE